MHTVEIKNPSRPGFGATKEERADFALFERTEPLRRNARTIAHQFIDARRKISGHSPDEARLARRLYVALMNFQTIRDDLRFAGQRGALISRTQIEQRLHKIAAEEALHALVEAGEIDRLAAADVDRSNAA
jgi:hypothetical protein